MNSEDVEMINMRCRIDRITKGAQYRYAGAGVTGDAQDLYSSPVVATERLHGTRAVHRRLAQAESPHRNSSRQIYIEAVPGDRKTGTGRGEREKRSLISL